MDVIKKKRWWQSDALKWSAIGLLCLLVGALAIVNLKATRMKFD